MAQLNFSISDFAQKTFAKLKPSENIDAKKNSNTDFSQNLNNFKNSETQTKDGVFENSFSKKTNLESNSQNTTGAENKVNAKEAGAQKKAEKNQVSTKSVESSNLQKKLDSKKEKKPVALNDKNTEKTEKNHNVKAEQKSDVSSSEATKNNYKDQKTEAEKQEIKANSESITQTKDAQEIDSNKKDTKEILSASEDLQNTDLKLTDEKSLELEGASLEAKDLLNSKTDIQNDTSASQVFDFANFFADENLNLDKFRDALKDLNVSDNLKDKLMSLSDEDLKSVLETLRDLFNLNTDEKLNDFFEKFQKIFVDLMTKLEATDIKQVKQDILNLTKESKPALAERIRKIFDMMPRALDARSSTQSATEVLVKDLLEGQKRVALNNQAQAQTQGRAPTSNLSASGDLNLELEAGLSRLVQDKLAQEKIISKQELNMQAQKILEAKGLENLNSLLKTARSGIDFLSTNSLSANPSGLASAARGANLPSLAIFNQAGSFNSEALMARINMMQSRNLKVADLRLDPPELGSVKVRIRLHNEQTTIHFQTPHPQVREVLEQNLPRLREMLQESGVDVADAGVSQEDFIAGNSQFGDETESKNKSGTNSDSAADGELLEANQQKDSQIALESLIDYYA